MNQGTKARGQRQMLSLTARDMRSASAARSSHGISHFRQSRSVMGGRGPVRYASHRRRGLRRQVGEQEGHPSGPRHCGDRHGVALSHGEQCSAECQPCTSCRAAGDSRPKARGHPGRRTTQVAVVDDMVEVPDEKCGDDLSQGHHRHANCFLYSRRD